MHLKQEMNKFEIQNTLHIKLSSLSRKEIDRSNVDDIMSILNRDYATDDERATDENERDYIQTHPDLKASAHSIIDWDTIRFLAVGYNMRL